MSSCCSWEKGGGKGRALPDHVAKSAGLGTELADGEVGRGIDGVEKGAAWVCVDLMEAVESLFI